MGSLFSAHHGTRPLSRPRCNYHKRKQRGLSVSSSTSGPSASKDNCYRVSIPYDGSANAAAKQANGTSSQNGAVANGSASQNGKHRRSSLKVALKRAYSSASASSNVLTEERRLIVQVSWQEITEKTGKLQASLAIFKSLFDACPELKRFFNIDSVSVDPSQTCTHFVRHARVFANVLDLAVRNVLELETEIGPILIMFGRRHFYKHQIGFRNEYLTLFAQSISDFVAANLSDSFLSNPEVTLSWRLFISYIIHKVKEGYDLECIQARKHSAVLY